MNTEEIFSVEEDIDQPIPELKVIDVQPQKTLLQKTVVHFKSSILTYFSISTIDGLYFLTINGIFHRLFWVGLFVVSLISCYFVTTSLFDAREIIVLTEKSAKSTFDIPFPAVTVCTTIMADHRKFNHNEIRNRVWQATANDDEINKYYVIKRTLSSMESLSNRGSPGGYKIIPPTINNITNYIYELGMKKEDLILSCSINRKSCNWSKILTPDGLCYVFNLAPSEEMFHQNIHDQYRTKSNPTKGWSFKNGYENDFDTNVYPLRGVAVNKDNELQLRLQMNHHNMINRRGYLDGFVIYIGHPMDYPYQEENRVLIPLNVQYNFNIIPKMVEADKKLGDYPLKARQCFSKETDLNHMKIFKEYTINNCQLECIAELSMKQCRCIEFFVPHLKSRTCGAEPSFVKQCYQFSIKMQLLIEAVAIQRMNFTQLRCNCIPPCASLTYEVHETMTGVVSSTNMTYNFSDITVKFSSSEFIPLRRQASFSDLELLSAIGGTLGIFVGASFSSRLIYSQDILTAWRYASIVFY